MDLPSDRVPESASSVENVSPAVVMAALEAQRAELHREINERRAQIENPELLRRLRSL